MTPAFSLARQLRHGHRAFTITELLVVITLIVILILIAVPSFQSMIYSSEEALAESQLRIAVRTARDAAVRSSAGNDGAAVFFYDRGGRLTVVPCVKVGELSDADPAAPNDTARSILREVFAAVPGYVPVSLPKNWVVRGFAPANAIDTDWYGSTTTIYDTNENNWVFPETDFFNVESVNDGFNRSTFMIRFQAGTGTLSAAASKPVLVFAPRASSAGRTSAPFSAFRADRAEDPVKFVRSILNAPRSVLDIAAKRQLIGRDSSDMVLARAVQQVTVYNEPQLARAFKVRVDSETGSIYQSPPLSNGDFTYTGYSPSLVTGAQPAFRDRLRDWIEGDTDLDAGVDQDDRPAAKLFAIDRYSGQVRRMEVQP